MTENKKNPFLNEATLEIIVVILLGITAIFTAWASWIGSLHGGNQATNYTESNNLSAEGNSVYNEAAQNYMQDMMTWNTIAQLRIDYAFAEEKGDQDEMDRIEYLLDQIIGDNCTPEFPAAIEWADAQEDYVTPFEKEGFYESYFESAYEVIDEGKEKLEQGKKDNANGDAFNLVTVIYSITLFLLGIVGIFKSIPNRGAVVIISAVIFIFATIYMLSLPMPTGFSLSSFFVK